MLKQDALASGQNPPLADAASGGRGPFEVGMRLGDRAQPGKDRAGRRARAPRLGIDMQQHLLGGGDLALLLTREDAVEDVEALLVDAEHLARRAQALPKLCFAEMAK